MTRRPFQSLAVSLAMSSPIFFGERPRGPIFGASELAAPTSPPVTRTKTSTTWEGSNFGGMVGWEKRIWGLGFGDLVIRVLGGKEAMGEIDICWE